MIVFLIWLALIILWNYGYPEASPLYDVIASVILFFFSKILNTLYLGCTQLESLFLGEFT